MSIAILGRCHFGSMISLDFCVFARNLQKTIMLKKQPWEQNPHNVPFKSWTETNFGLRQTPGLSHFSKNALRQDVLTDQRKPLSLHGNARVMLPNSETQSKVIETIKHIMSEFIILFEKKQCFLTKFTFSLGSSHSNFPELASLRFYEAV